MRPYRQETPQKIKLTEVIDLLPGLTDIDEHTKEVLQWLEQETEVTGYDYIRALAKLLKSLTKEIHRK